MVKAGTGLQTQRQIPDVATLDLLLVLLLKPPHGAAEHK